MKRAAHLLAIICIGFLASCSSSSKVEVAVKAANQQCPIDIGGGAKVTKIVTESHEIVFYCKCDEAQLGGTVTELYEGPQKSIIKEALTQELHSGSDEQAILDLCKEAQYNIKYLMEGSPSGEKVEITISHEEM